MLNKKIKLVTILGTRPEIIRLSEIIKKCDKEFNHILVHTGQNYDYELNQIFFDELHLRKPDYYLSCSKNNLGETLGDILSKSFDLLNKLKPDAILILGDTNSALSSIIAKRLKIPLFHMEAGNRCGDYNVPESINRKIVDHIADINLPYTNHAYKNLINEGLEKDYIFVTGSPMLEVLLANKKEIDDSDILNKLHLQKGKYIVVSCHREENIDNEMHFFSLMDAINKIAEKFKLPILFSTHPRTQKMIIKRNFKFHPLVKNFKPFGFIEYVNLEKNAFITLSDSGTVSEECSMLHFPAVLIRTSTERPEAIEAGNIVMGGINEKGIKLAIDMELMCYKFSKTPENYDVTNVSEKVVEIIQNKIDFVNKNVWKKGL